METNSGSSQPNTGPVLVPLEHYGHFMSAGLRGGKKHREILGGGGGTQNKTERQQISPSHGSHVLSVSLPSFLTPRGHLEPAGGPTHPCLHQSIRLPWRERTQQLPKCRPYPSLPPAPGVEQDGR